MRNREAGMSLIEIMIVVVIIGILASQAIPRFMYGTVRTHQKEALSVLKQIYVMQRAYFVEHETYFLPPAGAVASAADPTAFRTICVEVIGSSRYSYTIEPDGDGFVARAVASTLDDDPAVDEWTVDARGVVAVVSDDARI